MTGSRQEDGTWYHEMFAGATGKTQFICGGCLW